MYRCKVFCISSDKFIITPVQKYVHITARGKFDRESHSTLYDVHDNPLGNPSALMDIYLHMQRDGLIQAVTD